MDLTTDYLGMTLRSPLVVSSSTLSEELDNIKRMEDAGAGAVVLYSLFEEQLTHKTYELKSHLSENSENFAESQVYFPEPEELYVGPEIYLTHVQNAKASVDIPVIASLNGTTPGGWLQYATMLEEVGADALELNLYDIPTDMSLSGADLERSYLEIVRTVKAAVNIPVAVKLSPFFSNLSYMAKQFERAGANSLVMFNRFYQPDINPEALEIRSHLLFSTPQDLRLPLCWIGLLYGRVGTDFAATSGVRTALDAIKLLMVGANVTMIASALYKHGIEYLKDIETELRHWMEEHEYESIHQMRGRMSQQHCPDPGAFERAQYMRTVSRLFQNSNRHTRHPGPRNNWGGIPKLP